MVSARIIFPPKWAILYRLLKAVMILGRVKVGKKQSSLSVEWLFIIDNYGS